MRFLIYLAIWLLAGVGSASIFAQSELPTYKVGTAVFDWQDAARDRPVPAKVYYPEGKLTKSPVIIMSHGLGGTRYGYEYLGRYWASHGFVSVHVQHAGSDATTWQGKTNPRQAIREAVIDLRNVVSRPQDVSFAIDQLTTLAMNDPVWAGRLDLERIGCAGHSFGANTAMLTAGQTIGVVEGRFRDQRIKAVLAMSEPVPQAMPETVFAGVETPVFHMTGTLDNSPVGETMAAARRIPFDRVTGPRQYLLILKNGDHMVFAKPQTAEFERLIAEGSTAFWAAYLSGSGSALQWLESEYPQQLKGQGTFETKGSESIPSSK